MPFGFQEVEASRIYRQLIHESGEVFNPTNPQENSLLLIFFSSLSRPQGHIAYVRIKSMKNFSDPIGYRTRDPPTCSAEM